MTTTYKYLLKNKPKIKRHKRYGCDYCKRDMPTEKFIGYCGHILWICGQCIKKLQKPPKPPKRPYKKIMSSVEITEKIKDIRQEMKELEIEIQRRQLRLMGAGEKP